MFRIAKGLKGFVAGAVACGVVIAPTGCCFIPGLRGARSSPVLPADFRGASSQDNSANLGVKEFFQDPLLTTLVAQALSGNQELRVLDEEVQVAANEVLLRRGAYLPFLNLRADAGVEKPSFYTPLGAAEEQLLTPDGNHFPDPMGNFRVGLDFLWQIDIWRELRNARDAAAQRYAAAIERRNYFVTQMVAEIGDNYFELMALDQRLQILDQIIGLQQQSLRTATLNRDAGRDTDLPVQRFQAEVAKNQSERLIVLQGIVEAENRINFARGTYPQLVPRSSLNILDVNLPAVQMGMPAQMLQFRPDIRQAERELAAAGLDVLVARARFFPRLDITGSVGFEAFEPKYLFQPEAFFGNLAGGLVQPIVNWNAIRADYGAANARQLQALYNYQRTVLNGFIEVVNNLAKAENYRQSVELKRQQFTSLETSVDVATKLFMSNRAEYIDVLFSQRDLLDARTGLIDTKQQELSAIVNAYKAIGGGLTLSNFPQTASELYIESEPVPVPPAVPPAEPEDAPQGDALQGDAPQGDAPQGGAFRNQAAGRASIVSDEADSVQPLFSDRPTVEGAFAPRAARQPVREARVQGLFEADPAAGDAWWQHADNTNGGNGSADQVGSGRPAPNSVIDQADAEVEGSSRSGGVLGASAVSPGSRLLHSEKAARRTIDSAPSAPAKD